MGLRQRGEVLAAIQLALDLLDECLVLHQDVAGLHLRARVLDLAVLVVGLDLLVRRALLDDRLDERLSHGRARGEGDGGLDVRLRVQVALEGLAVEELADDQLLLKLAHLARHLQLLAHPLRHLVDHGVDHALGDGVSVDGHEGLAGGGHLTRCGLASRAACAAESE